MNSSMTRMGEVRASKDAPYIAIHELNPNTDKESNRELSESCE